MSAITSRIITVSHDARILKFSIGLLLLATILFASCLHPDANAAAGRPAPGGEETGEAARQAPNPIYLPMLVKASEANPQPTPTPEPRPQGFFVEPAKKTSRPGLQIDAQGGMHMAYRYHVPYAEHPQVVYAYCPPPSSQCTDPARWGRVAFLDRAEEVQIRLTPGGKPRLLAMIGEAEDSFSSLFVYAECDTNCLSEDSWSAIGVQTRRDTLGQVSEYDTPKRYFELDPQGRPRFAYYDNNYSIEPDHIGGFYLWCDVSCTEPGTWYETRFTHQSGDNYESISKPVLKFTRNGRPRILAQLSPLGNGAPGTELRFDVYYIGCDSDCEYEENWQRVAVAERGSGYQPAWDLELDPATDSPRAVNYQSGERKLFYYECDGDCFTKESWNKLDMSFESNWGVGVDLKLDEQGHRSMAFLNTARGLGVMFCTTNCIERANWSNTLVETLDDLDTAYPVARPVTCDNGMWDISSPSMAFDAQGNPHIIYDAAYQARCQYVDPTQPPVPTDVFHEIWHSVRYVTLR
jgi:hypothetical protein